MGVKLNPFTGELMPSGGEDTLGGLTPTKGNLAVGNGSTWVAVGVGANGEVLTADSAQSAGVDWTAVAGTGDVTAAASIGDNRIVRGDGGAKGVQTSLVSIGDTGNISGIVDLAMTGNMTVTGTVDGRDVATDGTKLDGIEAGADVTDATNVAAAGAIMDGDFSVSGNMVRTGAGTYTSRTVTGTASRVSVSNGDGVAGNPTLDIDASYVGQASITTLGTIATGVWNGTKVSEGYGGTNQTTYAIGDILYASGANTLAKLTAGSDGTYLKLASGVPSWASVSGGGDVTKVGTPVNNQVGVWTGDGTIEGDAAFTFDTTTDTLSTATLNLSGLTATELVASDGSKNLQSLAVATYPSLTEMTYVKGVTSAIQTQINAKQASDATLTALAAYNTNGLLTQTAADTFTGRTVTGTANEISVSNGDGVSGNPTLSLPATIDLGGKTSLEIPNSAAPTVDADGEIALDTTVTDFSHGILKYYGGEELAVVAMPIAQFTSPTNNYVVTYDSTADEFQLKAGGGGGSMPECTIQFPLAALRVNTTLAFPPIDYVGLGTVEDYFRAFDQTTEEYVVGTFAVTPDLDTAGTVTFEVWGKRASGTSAANVGFTFGHRPLADSEAIDGSYIDVDSGALACDTTSGDLDYFTFTATVSTLAWAANDLVVFRFSRDTSVSSNLAADYLGWQLRIRIPQA